LIVEEWQCLNEQVNRVERRIHDLLAVHGTTLTAVHGVGEISAAKIIAIIGGHHRFPEESHFASYTGTAPVDKRRNRLNRGGHRQLNGVLHTIATTQILDDTPDRAYYPRKIAEGMRFPRGAGHRAYAASGNDTGAVKPWWASYSSGGREPRLECSRRAL
jgi:transposase